MSKDNKKEILNNALDNFIKKGSRDNSLNSSQISRKSASSRHTKMRESVTDKSYTTTEVENSED